MEFGNILRMSFRFLQYRLICCFYHPSHNNGKQELETPNISNEEEKKRITKCEQNIKWNTNVFDRKPDKRSYKIFISIKLCEKSWWYSPRLLRPLSSLHSITAYEICAIRTKAGKRNKSMRRGKNAIVIPLFACSLFEIVWGFRLS